MGTGSSKNRRSTMVSSSQRRASRRESEEAEYVILPGIKNERLYHASHNTVADILDGLPAVDRPGMEDTSPSSVSSNSSSKSATEVLDDLRTELDQVLVGHYYALPKPAAGVLCTALLEKHNQVQPLPLNYQPVIGETTDSHGHINSDWVRPEDLVKQERDLVARKKREEERSVGQGVKKKDWRDDLRSSIVVHDLNDDQERGNFDIQKYQAVNIPKEEMDIFTQSTYKNYSTVVKKKDTSAIKNIQPRTTGIVETSTTLTYDPTEEELLESIEQDFN